ncbi:MULTISPECIES: sensor histidine kinase [Pseudoalteromonas]|uniref:Transcriptional regulator n=1 Tax=Pseudoalteromonas fuliginea TaxID=1872678 RepID=A0A833AH64_9GAMM|nr:MULTISPECIES: histidine kinase [Pseudoalteromonas]KAA1156013.1 transcriptional regulator [Pseudoalteromonas fuliginea]KAA1158012.1 transcriptional regulator [Pseudoalteromonas fuliginea]KAA1167253.1 transcriptional regulator [Pseudoalteromonas fuliginea]KDC54463.1 lysis regulatory protein [Pseudoalteromonas sp. S3431]MDQ2043699.1 histidine kinase [Pseudoalteromonas sp. 20-92]
MKLESRRYLFWAFQLSGWGIYALLTEIMIKLPSNEPWQIHIPHLVLDTLCGLFITLGLRKCYLFARTKSANISIPLHVSALLIASIVWTAFKWAALQWFYGHWWSAMSWFDFGTWSTASLTMLATWTGAYFGITSYLDNQAQKQKAAVALNLANEAQLKMLRYQLNPHFMFNSINAICTLILKKDNMHAVDMLEKLCDLLRYSLYTDPLAKITVHEEVQILNTYLDIEQCRFGNKLNVNIITESHCDDFLIPSMLIQPLVENALKHGMDQAQNITITLRIEQKNNTLSISVLDTGKGFNTNTNSQRGIGLKNCEQRLSLIYPQNNKFKTGNNELGGAWVNMAIPLERTQENMHAAKNTDS